VSPAKNILANDDAEDTEEEVMEAEFVGEGGGRSERAQEDQSV